MRGRIRAASGVAIGRGTFSNASALLTSASKPSGGSAGLAKSSSPSQKAKYRMEAERAVDLELLLASASNIAPFLQQNFAPTTRREAPRSEDDGVAVLDVLKCPPNT